MELFKKLAYKLFPEIEKLNKHSSNFSQIVLLFSQIEIAKNDEEVAKIYHQFNLFSQSLPEEEKQQVNKALESVKMVLDYAYCLITNPKEGAIALDIKIDETIKEETENHTTCRKNLLPEIANYSFQSATLSMIAMIEKKLSVEEEKEHLLLQQNRLNIALQTEWHYKHQINYWYALHCFLKNNTENTNFFLKKLFQTTEPLQLHDLRWLIDNNDNWLRNKIPNEFNQIVQEKYREIYLPNKIIKTFS